MDPGSTWILWMPKDSLFFLKKQSTMRDQQCIGTVGRAMNLLLLTPAWMTMSNAFALQPWGTHRAVSVSYQAAQRVGSPAFQPWQLFGAADDEDAADASESEAEEASNTEAPKPSAAAGDILNSPAFLQRKLQVLQSDLEKLGKEYEEATEQLKVQKLEWQQPLDDLRQEVSRFVGHSLGLYAQVALETR
jgi:hypothetical protein